MASRFDEIKVCGIQLSVDRDRAGMLEKAKKMIEVAFEEAGKNCTDEQPLDLVVLPEQFTQVVESASHFNEKYGEAGDEFQAWVSEIARNYSVNVCAGSIPVISENGKIYNRMLIVNRQGELVGSYDKLHLFDAFNVKESDVFESGENLGIYDLDYGRIGCWICYDSRFPEIGRALRARGAEIFVVPAAFYRPNYMHWDVLIKAGAIMNVTPIIAVNQCGELIDSNGKRGFVGNSMILNARGEDLTGIIGSENTTEYDKLAHMGDNEGYVIAKISKQHTSDSRTANPEFENRRMKLYKSWLEEA